MNTTGFDCGWWQLSLSLETLTRIYYRPSHNSSGGSICISWLLYGLRSIIAYKWIEPEVLQNLNIYLHLTGPGYLNTVFRLPRRPLSKNVKKRRRSPHAIVTSVPSFTYIAFLNAASQCSASSFSKVHVNEKKYVRSACLGDSSKVSMHRSPPLKNAQCETKRRALVGCENDVRLPKMRVLLSVRSPPVVLERLCFICYTEIEKPFK